VVHLLLLGALCLLLLSSWVLDSGTSFHVTSDKSQLVNCQAVHNGASVQTANGISCPITSHGSLSTPHFSVPNVSFVPQLSINLLSVGQITDQNCFIGFDDSSCFVQDRRTGRVIGTGQRRRGSSSLYVLDTLSLPASATSTARVICCIIICTFYHVASSPRSSMWISFVDLNK